jgi:large subunit ribosomal protein L3
MQVWPRKRAKRIYARVRSRPASSEAKPIGFAGYKVGMTHLIVTDNRKNSLTKNADLLMPATIIECPPLKIYGVNCYKKTPYGLSISSTILSPKIDKELSRKIPLPKKYEKNLDAVKADDLFEVRLLCYTQPKLTGLGKKKPELFEMRMGGSVAEQIAYAKENMSKEITIKDVFGEGAQIDIHAITKGHGNQGPVKRFGIKIRFHKSEKTKRGPGSLGAWHGPTTHRVAHAGQTGYHQRTDYNKWIVKIESDAAKVAPKGDWIRYGKVQNDYLIIKGSLPGPVKRLVTMTTAIRPNVKIPNQVPNIKFISTKSRQ